jgi:hypothetical protein
VNHLCPQCFNPPVGCECDPPFVAGSDFAGTPRRTTKSHWAESIGFMTIEEAIDQVDEPRRERVRALLELLAELGCRIEVPDAEERNYANIRPRAPGNPRVCALTLSTGRIEFQDESHAVARQLGIDNAFDRLNAGDKAAVTIETDEQLAAAQELARRYLPMRRA